MDPHKCPKCSANPTTYYGVLVSRKADAPKCPVCGTTVVPVAR